MIAKIGIWAFTITSIVFGVQSIKRRPGLTWAILFAEFAILISATVLSYLATQSIQ